jgi:replicative DNA helicase
MSNRKRALLRSTKMDNLDSHSMAEKQVQKSEADELESFLDELEKERQVREIAGWESGFPHLSRALNGIVPGLYLLIGAPGCGKTSFAKQLLDQVVKHNAVPGIFFSFSERKTELRIRTLARLSGLENREIRRGSAYLLHWYGVPKKHDTGTDRLPPSWEKLRTAAEEARSWLDLTYLVECDRNTRITAIEDRLVDIKSSRNVERAMVVVDDCQRLHSSEQALKNRLPLIAEQLQDAAVRLDLALVAVWPDLDDMEESSPQAWTERVPSVDVMLVMENDLQRTKTLTEPNRALHLHVIKNRAGEKGTLAFDFYPAWCKFVEATPA